MDDISLRPKLVLEVAAADYYCDYDGDGYISAVSYGTCSDNGCIPAGCQIVAGDDCDDDDEYAFPGATEIYGDGIDQDCDGSDLICLIDSDNDGIYDDGDNSGISGDNLCTGGNTINCDDNCINTPNANQSDVDSDGVGDVCDNCSQTANSGQQDTDSDGYGNMCDADLDNDGVVGFNDYNLFGNAWGSDITKPNWNPDADFDSDGVVGFNDYNIFGIRWGTSEPWH